MITLEDYFMGRDLDYPDDCTESIKANARQFLAKVNAFLDELQIESVIVNSGWRPPEINRSVGGAIKSSHLVGRGIDLADPEQKLSEIIVKNEPLLAKHGLYMESPKAAHKHVHLQDVPTNSGDRIFLP